jgi:membrane-associated phospholipid phosphatase
MRSRTIVSGGVLLGGLAGAAHAQSVGKMVEYDVRNAVVDMASVWLTPFRGSGRDWLTTVGVVAGSAAISPFDDNVDRWVLAHRNESAWSVLKELREGGAAYSGKTITPVVAGLYVIGLATKSTHVRDGVSGCAASYASSSVVRNYVFYEAIGRRRPDPLKGHQPVPIPAKQGDQYKFRGFPGAAWGLHSLPAGHIANIAACAGFLANRFEMGYAEPLVYLVTAGVGMGRILDRRHWTSDTMLGAVFGYAVGKEVALRSLRRREGSKDDAAAPAPQGFFVAPEAGGVVAGWQWTF